MTSFTDLELHSSPFPLALAAFRPEGLHVKLFSELCAPNPDALLLLAEAGERVRFAPTQRPGLPPPLRFVGYLKPEEIKEAVRHGKQFRALGD